MSGTGLKVPECFKGEVEAEVKGNTGVSDRRRADPRTVEDKIG